MEPAAAFGPRLRHERERRHISLDSIAKNTKISRSLLEGLERDDVKRWPSGIFRRSFVRSYAKAIGLDPDEVLREFQERFPDPEETATNGPRDTREGPTLLQSGNKTAPRISLAPSDDVEFVLRIRVPRSWASWIPWRA